MYHVQRLALHDIESPRHLLLYRMFQKYGIPCVMFVRIVIGKWIFGNVLGFLYCHKLKKKIENTKEVPFGTSLSVNALANLII